MRSIISKIATDTIAAAGGCGWLICKCGKRRGLTATEITQYLNHGWPMCCGSTMTWLTPREAMRLKGEASR